MLETGSDDILAIRYNYEGQSVIVVHNFNTQSRQVSIPADKATVLYNLMAENQDLKSDNGKFKVSLDGYGYKWFRVDHIIP